MGQTSMTLPKTEQDLQAWKGHLKRFNGLIFIRLRVHFSGKMRIFLNQADACLFQDIAPRADFHG